MTRKPNGYWTFEKCKEEALQYKNRTEFQKDSKGAYLKAYRGNWLDKICEHMEYINKPNGYWTFEKCKEEALKYRTRYDFKKQSPTAYSKSCKSKWLEDICTHMKEVIKPPNYWNFDRCKEEALQYKTRNGFQTQSRSAYKKSVQNKWLDEICSHMEEIKKPNNYWTFEKCKEEALKYDTRDSFGRQSISAYSRALNSNWLDKICSHMEKCSNTSKPEEQLFNLIKSEYPKAKKLRKRNIDIPDKPNIQSFEIDIYIPELRKGIEFDGDYWHSFDGLKKGRPNWKEEDLKNYHTIKDNYFKSQGIEIIHIKESDWKEDSGSELQKCLDFLKSNT